EMYIFNRWGEKLFYSNDINVGWDGVVNGNLSQTGSYVWKVNYRDAVGKQGELYGTVNLLK
ncbi:MAG: gliding motility-associated C-terminal domain-containing protein, partial [Vicingaceae bacterium]|nr:gliding motility-associated C-terminal domain-containing protein [Vicingaceae bacterium]